MTIDGPDRRILSMASAEAAATVREFDGALAWLEAARDRYLDPFAAEVWVLDAAFDHVLLVRHRRRGWVPPGGTVEPRESPRCAARRELAEETGLNADISDRPAAVSVRSFRAGWAPTLCLSYGTGGGQVASAERRVASACGVGSAGRGLEQRFPDDRQKIHWYAGLLSRSAAGQVPAVIASPR